MSDSDDDLTHKRCVPCEGGVPRLDTGAIARLSPQIPAWKVIDERRLTKRFEADDFLGAMAFVNKMAQLAEDEGHHPDFCVHYNVVDVTVWTHAISGLSENDFILAAKLDALGPVR